MFVWFGLVVVRFDLFCFALFLLLYSWKGGGRAGFGMN